MLVEIPLWLRRILACPACKGDVSLQEDKIVCAKCGRRYPVKRGADYDIPIMLVDKAEVPSEEKKIT